MKKLKFIAILLITSISALLLVSSTDSYYFKINKSFELFSSVIKQLSKNYVEDIDPETLVVHGIKGILDHLDPYTVYYDKKETEDIDVLTTGAYTGFGITVSTVDSMITIMGIRDGYPAQKHGLRIGDRIYKIDSTVVLNLSTKQLRQYTRGEAGAESEIYILRDGLEDTIHVTVPRQRIKIDNVSYSTILNEKIGYIKLERFSRNATEELRKALNELKYMKDLEGLILDLRDNPGGLLESAVSVSEIFVPDGSEIVSTKGRNDARSFTYKSNVEPTEPELPLIVLINNRSASASEIVAGAIQDLDRGLILGQRSYGKGLVQTVIDLPYDANLKLTTARYYTPSGRCIQRLNYDGVKNEKDTSKLDTNIFYTKNGRPVKEYKGILPDSIIDDEKAYSEIVRELKKQHLIFKYANEFTGNKDSLGSEFKTEDKIFSKFNKYVIDSGFIVNSSLHNYLETIRETAEKEEYSDETLSRIEKLENKIIAEQKKELKSSKEIISELLDKEIRKRFSGEKEIIKMELDDDKTVITAMHLIKTQKYRKILALDKEKVDKSEN